MTTLTTRSSARTDQPDAPFETAPPREPIGDNRTPASRATPVDGALLRDTLRRHAAGVTVLTAPGPVGFTATSFTPVSLDPALVSFYVGNEASVLPTLVAHDHFGVNILGRHQTDLAFRFARRGIDRFAGVDWALDEDGVPLLRDVPAWLRGRITLRQRIGDHVLIVGEVLAVGGTGPGAALVHHHGRIVGLDAEESA